MISIQTFKVGRLKTNCYVIHETIADRFAIVDPGKQSNALDLHISKINSEQIDFVLLTHGHFDHIGYAKELSETTGAKIVICKKESEFLKNPDLNLSNKFNRISLTPFFADILVEENSVLKLGDAAIRIIETPGHTIGSVCYIVDEHLFSGDTLMYKDVGRVDLPTGDPEQMRQSLEKLKNLNYNYNVYPGHGQSTTLKQNYI